MTNDQMQELARVGAQARLQAIDEERSAILRAFPVLGSRPTPARSNGSPAPARRTRKGMSPARRKAVGERMKAYWAKRRREKAGKQTQSAPQAESATEAATTPAKQPSQPKPMSPGRKAQAEKMRAYWAARRGQKQAGPARRAGRKTGRKK